MATAESVKAKLQGLIDKANETTGGNDTTLTAAVDALASGYGLGSSGGGFTPQTGSFVPTAQDESIIITLNDDIPDNFMIFTILHDKNVETFINAGFVVEIRLHFNGKMMIMRGASATNALLSASRHYFALDGTNDNPGTYNSYDPETRTLRLGARPSSNWYSLQYDYCIVPYGGINMEGWFA